MKNQPESIGEVFHKEKEPKRKLNTKGQSPIGLSDYRTIGENTLSDNKTQMPKAPSVEGLQGNRSDTASRTRNQIINIEIDEWLITAVQEGLVDPSYMPYFAKACHILGLTMVNQLKINAVNGREPQKLFAYKVRGAMQLHFKRQFYAQDTTALTGDFDD